MFWIPILCQLYEIVCVDILVIIVFQSDVKFRDKEFLKLGFGSLMKGQRSFIQGMPFRAVHRVWGDCCTSTLCTISFASIKCHSMLKWWHVECQAKQQNFFLLQDRCPEPLDFLKHLFFCEPLDLLLANPLLHLGAVGHLDVFTASQSHFLCVCFFKHFDQPSEIADIMMYSFTGVSISPALQPEFRILTHPSASRRECSLFWYGQCSQSDFERGSSF